MNDQIPELIIEQLPEKTGVTITDIFRAGENIIDEIKNIGRRNQSDAVEQAQPSRESAGPTVNPDTVRNITLLATAGIGAALLVKRLVF